MLALEKIAVTGGLSCGKSTVCRLFKELGAYTISADQVVHDLLDHDASVRDRVVSLLGSDILVKNQLDRKIVAQKVFSHPETLKSLESILHPLVLREIQLKYDQIKDSSDYTFFLAEIPLLYETGGDSLFDHVIAVLAEESVCNKRFHDVGEFKKRIRHQMDPHEKAERADFVIWNNGSLEELKNKVLQLSNQLKGDSLTDGLRK